MEVNHTPVDKPTPRDASTALNHLPQRVATLVKKYESSNAGGFEDFERELHALFAQTECAVTEEALARHDVDLPLVFIDGEMHRRACRCAQTYLTAAGPVSVTRTLYRARRGERAVAALERKVGIVQGYWTPLAARQGAMLVSHLTPRDAEEVLATLGHMQPSKSSLDHDRGCQLTTHKLQQCYRCNRQTSITAGTIFEATKLPLTVWLQGIYFMTQDKKGVSAMKLHRQLGISYNAAWRMRHKLMQVMMERDREHPLGGFIQLDDAYLGGERSGGKRGRGAPGKTPFVAAVETNAEGHPLRVKLTVVEGFRLTEIAAWAQQHLSPGTQVLSDGLSCFNGVTAAGCVHEPMVTGGGKAAVERPEFRWVNTILGNIKTALRGTYHAVRPKYAQRYLAEFEYRFNRRFDLPDIIPRLVYVALRTPPMPERLLKLRLA